LRATASSIRAQFTETGAPELVLSLKSREALNETQELKQAIAKGKELDVEVKVHRNKRSLDANGFCWVMCQKIAEKLSLPQAPVTKDDIYRQAIRQVGQFTILPIRNDAVETWIHNWGAGRIGWVCENLGESKLEGYSNIRSYYGSSVYDTKSMSVLIDYIVSEAKEQGVETMTPAEIALLKQDWGK
jgi:ribosomal protein L9